MNMDKEEYPNMFSENAIKFILVPKYFEVHASCFITRIFQELFDKDPPPL